MKIVRYLVVGDVAALVNIGFLTVPVKGLGFDFFFVAFLCFVLATTIKYVI